jgi:hypothetical protein
MRTLAAALASSVAALIALGTLSAVPAGRVHFVSASRGNDSWPGTARAPWRTLGRANRVAPGATVRVAAGTYADAPTAPGVRFMGADPTSKRERIVTRVVSLSGRGTQITGFTLAGGLDFDGGARDNLVDRCVVRDHWGMWGSASAAPRGNRITRTRMDVHEIGAHTYGDDRDRTVPRIAAPSLVDCDVTVRRSGGVLWRWSGVDDANIVRTKIRLVNGGHHNSEDASWKWFYVRRARITDSRIVLDHSASFGETGPFAPMWRDSTWGTRMVRTRVEALRGGMIFSPNTAGTWGCSCGGHRFEDVVLRAPGTIWFYQCPRDPSDTWLRSRVYAGRLDEYNTGRMPAGLEVRRYAGASTR